MNYENSIRYHVKKEDSDYLLDEQMSFFFTYKLCDLIGLYSLNNLEFIYDIKKVSLYIDDDLAIVERKNNKV